MFSTPLIFCSSGVATEASTSVALAPMNVVVTWIMGGTISGYCAMGRPRMATKPSRTRMIDRTIATIGRLTKKLAMRSVRDRDVFGRAGWRLTRLRVNLHPFLDELKSFDHNVFTRFQAFLDHPQHVHPRADLHVAKRDRLVWIDHGHAVEVLQLLNRALRHQKRPGPDVDQD